MKTVENPIEDRMGRADLKPLDYRYRNILEEKAGAKHLGNIENLKTDLMKTAVEIPIKEHKIAIPFVFML